MIEYVEFLFNRVNSRARDMNELKSRGASRSLRVNAIFWRSFAFLTRPRRYWARQITH